MIAKAAFNNRLSKRLSNSFDLACTELADGAYMELDEVGDNDDTKRFSETFF